MAINAVAVWNNKLPSWCSTAKLLENQLATNPLLQTAETSHREEVGLKRIK